MRECVNAEMRDLLPDLLHGTVQGAARDAVEAHVAGCPACARELALLDGARNVLAVTPSVDIARITGAVRAVSRRPRTNPLVWRVAAALVAIAVGATSIELATRPDTPFAVTAAATGDSATPNGSDTGSLAFASGSGDLSAEDLARVQQALEQFDGLTPIEPRAVIPTAGLIVGGTN